MRLVIPLVVLVAVAAVLLVVLTGDRGEGGSLDGATLPGAASSDVASVGTAPADAAQPGDDAPAMGTGLVVLVEDEGSLMAAVVLQPRVVASSSSAASSAATAVTTDGAPLAAGRGGVALAVPPETLLRTDTAFKTLAQIRAGDIGASAGVESAEPDEAEIGATLTDAFASLLGTRPAATLSLEWAELQQALAGAAPVSDTMAAAPVQQDHTDLEQMARAVLSLAAVVDATGTGSWEEGTLGESDEVGDVVRDLSSRVKETPWDVRPLPGTAFRGEDYAYFEPDPLRVALVIAGGGLSAGTTLAIQNGSGVVGAAEAAAWLLEPLGYALRPFTNAPGFPDVKTTVILTHPDGAAAAEQARALLGVGRVRQDGGLAAGELVVVVGKDLVVPAAVDEDAAAAAPRSEEGV